jgi:antitoxin component YwqK of YwqJK toxin-antitoxin module
MKNEFSTGILFKFVSVSFAIICLLSISLTAKIFGETLRKTTEYYCNGSIKKIIYYSDFAEIAKEMFDEKGVIKKNGKIPNGLVKEYYDDGKLKAIYSYRNNYRNGEAERFFKCGKICISQNFYKDKLTGKLTMFNVCGQIVFETEYIRGMKNGISTEYTSDNQINMQEYYCNDKLTRRKYYQERYLLKDERFTSNKLKKITWYFEKSKNIRLIENYKYYLLNGLVKEFYENGKVRAIKDYEYGELKVERNFAKNGKLVNCVKLKPNTLSDNSVNDSSPLYHRLVTSCARIRLKALNEINKMSDNSKKELSVKLEPYLESENKDVRCYAIDGLSNIGIEAYPVLLKALRNKDHTIQNMAMGAIYFIKPNDKNLLSVLSQVYNENPENLIVRRSILEFIREIGPAANEMIPFLVDILKHNCKTDDAICEDAHFYSILALDRLEIESKFFIPVLILNLKSKAEDIKQLAMMTLLGIGSDTLPYLQQSLDDRDVDFKGNIQQLISQIDSE